MSMASPPSLASSMGRGLCSLGVVDDAPLEGDWFVAGGSRRIPLLPRRYTSRPRIACLAGAFLDQCATGLVADSGASTTTSTSREIDRDRDVGWTRKDQSKF